MKIKYSVIPHITKTRCSHRLTVMHYINNITINYMIIIYTAQNLRKSNARGNAKNGAVRDCNPGLLFQSRDFGNPGIESLILN